MTRTIEAKDILPGMTIRWEQEDLVFEFPVARAIQFGDRRLLRTPMRKVVMIPPDTEVTVLSEPSAPQPEAPERIDEWPEDDTALRPYPWRDNLGKVWRYGIISSAAGWSYDGALCWGEPLYGSWIRVTDA